MGFSCLHLNEHDIQWRVIDPECFSIVRDHLWLRCLGTFSIGLQWREGLDSGHIRERAEASRMNRVAISSLGIFLTQGSNAGFLCLLHCRGILPAEPSGSRVIYLGESSVLAKVLLGQVKRNGKWPVRVGIHLNSACWESYWLFMQRL